MGGFTVAGLWNWMWVRYVSKELYVRVTLGSFISINNVQVESLVQSYI